MDAKTSRLYIRLSAAEAHEIRKRASAAGLSVSEYVRRRSLDDADRPVIRICAEETRSAYGALRRSAGNLNQCAKALNKYHCPEQLEADLASAFEAVKKASDDVSALIADARNSV